jgi:hypothetical protein
MIDVIEFIKEYYPAILLLISNGLTFMATKKHYHNFKMTFYEFCDFVNAIKQAWLDDTISETEIVTVKKELDDLLKAIKQGLI